MERRVTIVTQYGEFKVSSQKLAKNLRDSAKIAKIRGVRPGQPVDFTKTPSDPISHERFYSLYTILEEHRGR